MITDEEFKKAIGDISDSYEAAKDAVYSSDLPAISDGAQKIIMHLAALRDTACTALREAHINKNFKDN